MSISNTTLEQLRGLDTPTVCNSIELLDASRRTVGFSVSGLICIRPELSPLVGYARTATIRAREPGDAEGEKRREFLSHVDSGPSPTIAVIQDLDDAAGFGAFWGEVMSTVFQTLGCIGTITNGSVRDLDDCAPGFQLIAGSVGPSRGAVHVVDSGIPVTVAGMQVSPGDLVHADKHGAVVIPGLLADDIIDAAAVVVQREKVILDACRSSGASLGTIRDAMKRSGTITFRS